MVVVCDGPHLVLVEYEREIPVPPPSHAVEGKKLAKSESSSLI